jgi:formate/nitrite transporter FocA (FNT family)
MTGYLYNLAVVGFGNLCGGAVVLGGGYWFVGRAQPEQSLK